MTGRHSTGHLGEIAQPSSIRRPSSVTPPPGGRAAVDLLGCFRLRLQDAEVPLSGRSQRMVALLALRGRMSRSRLAGTLWPDSAETRALASLRTAIWRTNLAAPGVVMGVGDMVDLDPTVLVDVHSLVRTARLAIQDDGVPDIGVTCVPGVDGDLLPDWQEDWLADERERLRQLRLHVQEELAAQLASKGRYGLALDIALAALSTDTLRESAHRSVIRIHLAEGNIGEARRAYEVCRRVLEEELGVPPSVETRRLCSPFLAPTPGRRGSAGPPSPPRSREIRRSRSPRPPG